MSHTFLPLPIITPLLLLHTSITSLLLPNMLLLPLLLPHTFLNSPIIAQYVVTPPVASVGILFAFVG